MNTLKKTQHAYKRNAHWLKGLNKSVWELRGDISDTEWETIKPLFFKIHELDTAIQKVFIPRLGRFSIDELDRQVK